jgi:hypothetical protein
MVKILAKTLNYFFTLSSCILLVSCGKCDKDQYGETLWLSVPVDIAPKSSLMELGDSIWVEVDISKNVYEQNSGMTITLDSFNFFTEIFISRIDDTIQHFPITESDILEDIGELIVIQLVDNARTYRATYVFDQDRYTLKVGFVPSEPGIYAIAVVTQPYSFELYNHPAMFECTASLKRRRIDSRVFYPINNSDAIENHYDLFLETPLPYLAKIDEEQYVLGGWYAFRVVD